MPSPPRNHIKSRPSSVANRRAQAGVFAALADPTRLSLVAKLSEGQPRSIAQLTSGSRLTRQAITKHLRVMERAKMVRCTQAGRESLFTFNPKAMLEISEYLARISSQWDQAILRLQAFAQSEPPE